MALRLAYEAELEELSKSLELMCAQVEHKYDRLFECYEKKDKEGLQNILKSDLIVNDMERKIEAKALKLITKQQPIAKDLRLVSAALKVVTDLEREGVHIVDIAELFLRIEMKELSNYSVHLPQMIKETKCMMRASVDAFIARDEDAARRVILTDEIIDSYFNKVKEDIISHIRLNTQDADECMDILMLAKYLEKIGDHAENIGNWTIFMETGNMKDVRLL